MYQRVRKSFARMQKESYQAQSMRTGFNTYNSRIYVTDIALDDYGRNKTFCTLCMVQTLLVESMVEASLKA